MGDDDNDLGWDSILEQKEQELDFLMMNASVPVVQVDQAATDTTPELSDKELVAYMKKVHVKKDFTKLEKEYVLPMNITEVWSTFFDNGAKYSFDNALVDLGDKFKSSGKWKKYTKKHNGE